MDMINSINTISITYTPVLYQYSIIIIHISIFILLLITERSKIINTSVTYAILSLKGFFQNKAFLTNSEVNWEIYSNDAIFENTPVEIYPS